MLRFVFLFSLFISFASKAHAVDCTAEPTVADQIQCLQDGQDALEAENAALQARLDDLEAWYDELNDVMYVDVNNDVIFEGTNVYVQKGWGDTWGDGNGLGNLIIGYNELGSSSPIRTGSHNLIIGPYHSYTSYGSIVQGRQNESHGAYSFLLGGSQNVVEFYATNSGILAGLNNTITGYGDFSAIVSGGDNILTAERTVAIGGFYNEVTGPAGVAINGYRSFVTGHRATTVGGRDLEASGTNSLALGGDDNVASGVYSATLGGMRNQASGGTSVVSGGYDNRAIGSWSTVNGGNENDASGTSSTVLGGFHNDALHRGSVVLGNQYIFTTADYSIKPW
ncbi:hypothetical protein HN358_00335 [Candidatus Uhrbacteria bacterium]|jgi:hypothetical protein|nr:hypothetical protein [Candidatus Uhrbacteria bacterium]MBT7717711.1 hypothetical protein [Candidatus Uhrbacteria bacterium]